MNCECDKFLHEPPKPRCEDEPYEPEGVGGVRVVSSPALCVRCLFYCWNDED